MTTATRPETERPVPSTSRYLALFLDDLIRIPGTNIGIGADALVGLVPGIGDLVGTGLSGAVLVDAVRCRVPVRVLMLMAWNLILDTLLGYLPGVGDIADVAHRANRKNVRLLEDALARGQRVDADARGYALHAGLVVGGVLLFMLASAIFVIWGLTKLFGLL